MSLAQPLPSAGDAAMLPALQFVPWSEGGRTWSIVVSEDLLAAACEVDGAGDRSVGDGGAGGRTGESLRPRLADALAEVVRGAPQARRWRATVDSGDALWGAVIERPIGRIRLGSPGFAIERGLAALGERLPFAVQRGEGDRLAAMLEHAGAWAAVGCVEAPLDVQAAATLAAMPDLVASPALADDAISAQVRTFATEVAGHMRLYRPSALERLSQWGLALQADHPLLRVHALRLIAALPSLDHDRGGSEVKRLALEMLRRMQAGHRRAVAAASPLALPARLATALGLVGALLAVTPAAIVAWVTRAAVRKVAGIFIAGEDVDRAAPTLQRLLRSRRAATLDQLGELVVTEAEADAYRDAVLQLVRGAAAQFGRARNEAGLPLAHVSVKVSALTAHYDGDDPDGTARRVVPRLQAILRAARDLGVCVQLDAEHHSVRDLTLAMLRASLDAPDLAKWSDVGIVIQAYLRDAMKHFGDVLALARARGVRMPIRLVKGAYWDAETMEADASGYDAPQWLDKRETDVALQTLTLAALAAGDALQLALGSHNLRDHAFARAARALRFPEAPPVEHQCLHATYEALSTAMAQAGWPVRNYIPVGSMLTGMAYLVRRVIENSSQVGVLTMARRAVDLDVVLRDAARELADDRAAGRVARRPLLSDEGRPLAFRPCAPARLHLPLHRAALDEAIAIVRAGVPLPLGASATGEPIRSHCPEQPDLIVAQGPAATAADVHAAVTQARAGLAAWQRRRREGRAIALLRSGEWLRARRPWLGAIVALEAGKARREALADIDEAIDFCRWYAMQGLDVPPAAPGHGVIAVIAPWNFPIAIPCGMATAALAAGNAAMVKSAEQTPLCGELVVQALRAGGVPADVVVHLAGDGPGTGAALVEAAVDGTVFTGSAAVGTALYLAMQRPGPHGRAARLAITEMGGKNAIVVTASADLDEAVAGCLRAAFGHAGQKCSAASRVLIDERVFERFVARLGAAARDLQVGPATAPGTHINPVVSADDAERLRRAAAAVIAEALAAGGRVVCDGSAALADPGHCVAPTIVTLPAAAAQRPESWAQREIFGPIVHCIPCAGLDQALELQGSVAQALTGGIYSQSEDDVDLAVARARVGNLYVNRAITGARVGLEPFGGFAMSGTGPKAGGVDVLPVLAGAPPILAGWQGPSAGDALDAHLGADGVDNARLGRPARVPAAPSAAGGAMASHGEALLPAAQALVGARRPTPAIPGQQTWEQLCLRRGPVAVVCAEAPSAAAWRVAAAAWAVGNPVTLVVAASQVAAATTAAGGMAEVVAGEGPDAVANALAGRAWGTLVADGGALAPPVVAASVTHGLPQLLDAAIAASGDDRTLIHGQLLANTVAVNTLRYGAPLVLDLGAAG